MWLRKGVAFMLAEWRVFRRIVFGMQTDFGLTTDWPAAAGDSSQAENNRLICRCCLIVCGFSEDKLICPQDHKPDAPREKQWIEERGGYVAKGRLGSFLAMSRAFGDASLKQTGRIFFEQVFGLPCFSAVPLSHSGEVRKANSTTTSTTHV